MSLHNLLEVQHIILLVKPGLEDDNSDMEQIECQTDFLPVTNLLPEGTHFLVFPNSFQEKDGIRMDMFHGFFQIEPVLFLLLTCLEENKIQ